MDSVTLQVLLAAMRSICEQMGAVLISSAHSANIKERRDASTAIFNHKGEMVMQAEHIPVHLGSMPDAVAAVLGRDHNPGDIYAINDPFSGGTHLPDITLISPLLVDSELIGFAASRAHHADVGGTVATSMPAISTEIYQEGLILPAIKLVRAGDFDGDLLNLMLTNMRNRRQREGDLRAQLAANESGIKALSELCQRYGIKTAREAMDEVLDYSERRTRAAIAAIPDGTYRDRDVLEAVDGSEIVVEVTITVDGESIDVDFIGSCDQVGGNLNCPLSVTKSAVYFALKVATDPDIPASAGAYRTLSVQAREGSLLNAVSPAAVVGGNVETSSRIADVVISALGKAIPLPALGQGTMNNLTFSSRNFTYYETLGGGQGACPDADGPSGVHVAMSNTLNTPIEAVELEFPLRVKRYELRRGSGGDGKFKGGDGLVREFEALEPMHFTILSERRNSQPRGSSGGSDGNSGRNLLNGKELPSKCEGELKVGDRLTIETPGGGGYGKANAI